MSLTPKCQHDTNMTLVIVWSNGSVVKYLLREKEKEKKQAMQIWFQEISSRGIQSGPFGTLWANFVPTFISLLNLNHVTAHFLSLREGKEGRQMISNYLHNTTIALVMGWSNGSAVKCLLRKNERGKYNQCWYDFGISVSGAFKLDHVQAFKHILYQL